MTRANGTPVLVTYDWVPDFPRGFVRDLRVRWAFEELGQPYRIETVPVGPKSAAHLAMQPFGQIPILRTGPETLFESGAILLSLAGDGTALMPPGRRPEVTQWLISALNSVETMTLPWVLAKASERAPEIFGPAPDAAQVERAAGRMKGRLDGVARALADRDWLVGNFSAADIIMADVLRTVGAEGGLDGHPTLAAYVARATARPAFRRAHEDHMAHWRDADAARKQSVA